MFLDYMINISAGQQRHQPKRCYGSSPANVNDRKNQSHAHVIWYRSRQECSHVHHWVEMALGLTLALLHHLLLLFCKKKGPQKLKQWRVWVGNWFAEQVQYCMCICVYETGLHVTNQTDLRGPEPRVVQVNFFPDNPSRIADKNIPPLSPRGSGAWRR